MCCACCRVENLFEHMDANDLTDEQQKVIQDRVCLGMTCHDLPTKASPSNNFTASLNNSQRCTLCINLPPCSISNSVDS